MKRRIGVLGVPVAVSDDSEEDEDYVPEEESDVLDQPLAERWAHAKHGARETRVNFSISGCKTVRRKICPSG
eukprot:291919-Pelagomonas_calceolata.AAC.2